MPSRKAPLRTLLTALATGLTACVAPAAVPQASPEPRVMLRIVSHVQPTPSRALFGFSPYRATDLARITLTLDDITATPTVLAQQDLVTPAGGFELQALRPYRHYRLRLQGFRDPNGQELISVDDASSATLHTHPDASGTLTLAREVRVPLRLMDRLFRGALDARVYPTAGQAGMLVRLEKDTGATWDVQLATHTIGAASASLELEGLALDARYRLVRNSFTGASPTLTWIGEASLVIDTASTALGVFENGEVASVTLGDPL